MIALVNNTLLRLMAAVQARKMQAEEEGQTLVEYALILALVSVVAIALLFALGGEVKSVFQEVIDGLRQRGSGG